VATDERAAFKTRLLAAVCAIALVGWGVAGYAFWSASDAGEKAAARLRQSETARQDVARKLDEQVKAAGTFAELQGKIADAHKQLDAATRQRDDTDQQDETLRQQGDQLKAAIAGATTARDQVQSELQQLRQNVIDAQAKLEALRTQAEANLKQAQEASAAAVAQLNESRAKVDAAH
jgi:chromosome segregation ATPase